MMYMFLIIFLFKQVLGSSECITTNFTATSGQVDSVTKSNSSCNSYIINVESKLIQLSWNYFEMDGTMPSCKDGDYVEVFIGCRSNKNLLSLFCSRNMKMKPHPIYSYDGCIEIVHRKNVKSLRDNYFSAFYTTFSQNIPLGPTTCSSSSTNQFSSGLIISPFWPLTYQRSLKKCKWSVNSGDSMDVIMLNVMDLDIYREGSSCKDKLYIKGIKSLKKWEYCENRKPFSIITDYYNLEFQMDILNYKSLTSNRGFVIGITAWKSTAILKLLLNRNVTKYVLPALFVVVAVIFILVYRCIQRRRNSHRNKNLTPQYGAVPNAETIDLNVQNNPQVYETKPSSYPVQQPYPPTDDGLKQPYMYPPPTQQYQAPLQQYQGPPSQYPAPFQSYPTASPQQYPLLQQNTGIIEPPPPPYPGT